MIPGLDFYNAGRSWRRALKEWTAALYAHDHTEDRLCRARWKLIEALERAEAVGVLGEEGRIPRILMLALKNELKALELPSTYSLLTDARRLEELFGLKDEPRPRRKRR